MSKANVLAPTKTNWTDAELDRLTKRAQSGDSTAMAELRRALDTYPSLARQFCDMALFAREKMAETTFGKDNLLLKEMLERRVRALRQELEGDNPAPLERMLVERVVTCWVGVYLADMAASANGGTLARAEYYDKRHERAHRRYLAAAVALARVRRLLSPMIAQVNIAQAGAQQLNVTTATDLPVEDTRARQLDTTPEC